ncbi:MAG: hypothetical protein ACFB2Y_19135 [Fulvivirga sp.]
MLLDSKGNPINNRNKNTPLKDYWRRFNKWIIASGAFIAVLAGILGNLEKIKTLIVGKNGDLEVTKIIVDSYRKDFSCLLDFRVLNKGNQTTIINKVIFECYYVKSEHTNGLLDISASYDLDISNIQKEGDKAELVVSQVIKPNEADRFTISLVAKGLQTGEFRKWGFHIMFETSDGIVDAGFVPKDPFSSDFVMLPWNIDYSSRIPL